jgi:hypothetical protein
MPLRDHFRPPLNDATSWDGFHGQWPAMIVRALASTLPLQYTAEPLIHTEPGMEEYEVRVFDRKRGRRLVAAVEIVSPANKDRPDHRDAFVAKCAALLQQQVSVSIVDLVTTRNFNLYAELLEFIGRNDPYLGAEPPSLYAVSCRGTKKEDAWLLETWSHALTLGQPLPTLPLWLADNLAVPLELEECYEETCRVLRIP